MKSKGIDAKALQKQDDHWDIEIRPKSSLLSLNLSDVWHYRDLLWLFVRRDFVAQYKQTILGPLWHLVQPVFTTVIFLIVFNSIAKIPTEGVPATLFYLSGITLWSYFSSCLINTSNTFVSNAGIFGKVYFPRLILPLSVVISTVIRLIIQFALLLAVMLWYYLFMGFKIPFGINWLLIPGLVALMAGIGLGLGIIISSLTTKYRDMAVLVGFAVQLAMYVTPIAYPLSYLSHTKFKWLIELNPLSSVVELFRYILLGTGTFSLYSLGYSVVFMIVVLIAGTLLFNKVEKSFMDTV